jgi:hypothetical protein
MSNNIGVVQKEEPASSTVPPAAGRLVILASARPGERDELYRWYDQEHIPEILATHAFVRSVQRYDVSDVTTHPVAAPMDRADSIAVYEVDGSPRRAWEEILTGPRLGLSKALDYASLRVLYVEE